MSSRVRIENINLHWSWSAAWRWWREGLLAWLPADVRQWLAGSSRRLVILADGGELMLLREEGDQTQELERLDAVTPDWGVVAAWFKSEKPSQLVLRFPADQTLRKTLSLPLAAEKNLRQVAGFEMDRLTPFTAAQVYYDVSVVERQPADRRLHVKLTALPRVGVDPILTQLQQRGLQLDTLDVVGGAPDLNLLPVEQRKRRGVWEQRLLGVLIIAALLLVATAAILPIWQQRMLVIETMAKVNRLQQGANQVLNLREQLDRTLESSKVLAQQKRTTQPRVSVLQELTAILPDDTWLERLQIKGDTVQIIGQSAKASALVGIVESSDLLSNASFISPVTIDSRTNKERFSLGARIAKEH
ncbi:MAG: PilN domain-containing protein [Candidatus Competibacteraceae bacterium]|nr:PilN domain-containing protein [Candidatus Competibacteraceae bacterium]